MKCVSALRAKSTQCLPISDDKLLHNSKVCVQCIHKCTVQYNLLLYSIYSRMLDRDLGWKGRLLDK